MNLPVNNDELIIEVGIYQSSKHGQLVCGDTFLSKKISGENRYIAVLSDGLGSGIKANVLSSLTASMALNFRLHHEPLINAAKWVMDALPVDTSRGISYATFTIVDVDFEGETTIVEYGNPSCFIDRNGRFINPHRTTINVDQAGITRELEVASFRLHENDRLIVVTDGITQSGIGFPGMPFGWGNEKLQQFVADKSTSAVISAGALAKSVVTKATANDIYKLQDDASCAVFYRRKPRHLLFCTGPPYNPARDKYLADAVAGFNGTKVICGGTTSKILSRELKRDISSLPRIKGQQLPPTFKMDGVDLVTEGILTLEKTLELLLSANNNEVNDDGPAGSIAKYMLQADVIHFLVGTGVNIAHQDPDLPVELQIRRNVVKPIIRTLEDKFLKHVNIQYI